MIREVSDFLQALIREEQRKLDDYILEHRPTIGKMYEGLTTDILEKSIPASLGLKVVNGFISYGGDSLSGEIDCMLVSGEGEQIPYTETYKYPIDNVLAVFEVKKKLKTDKLDDAFTHLSDIVDSHFAYLRQEGIREFTNVGAALRSFEQITGVKAPESEEDKEKLSLTNINIYHTLLAEQISPLRIVLGYHGYKKEATLRNTLTKYLKSRATDRNQALGVKHFPQLIICGDCSLIKSNGMPYSLPMSDDYWTFYSSSNCNPIHLILEFVWTRLTQKFDLGYVWGDDLEVEAFAPLVEGRVIRFGGRAGWEYRYYELTSGKLKDIPRSKEWEPTIVNEQQFNVFNLLCAEVPVEVDDAEFIDAANKASNSVQEFIDSLTSTGFVCVNGKRLELSTKQLQCAIVPPNGDFVVAENNSGRLNRWLSKRHKSKKG